MESDSYPGGFLWRHHGRRGGRSCAIATGSDGGGSIRIPAGFSGLFGLKATYGRIPKGPVAGLAPRTSVLGCLSRSVRDTARYFDAINGFDQRDPMSLPRVSGWEAGLGTHDLAAMTVAILPDLGVARVRAEVADQVTAVAEHLAEVAGLRIVDVSPDTATATWPVGNGWTGGIRGRPRRGLSRPDRRTVEGNADRT